MKSAETTKVRKSFRHCGWEFSVLAMLTLLSLTNTVFAGWDISTVDSVGAVGEYTSIACDSSNNPHISYRDGTNGDLKYAKWIGSAWSIQTVDSTGNVGYYTSLALDISNNPHISYWDATNADLKYAKWTGSAWSIQTVDSAGDVGRNPSIVLDSSNNPHISYYDFTNGDLKYAMWTGSSWSIQTVDSQGDVGYFTSIALDTSNNPNISYYDATNQDIKYARWTGSSWSIQTVDSVGNVGYDTSIALDTSNNPHISYYDATNGDLKYTKWSGSSWSTQTVESSGIVGFLTSITLDTSNNPHISYSYETNFDLKYARWTGSSWSIQTVDNTGNVGRFSSIALDLSNIPHISYYDNTNGDLKYVKGGMPPTGTPSTPTDNGAYSGTTTLTFTWTQGTASDSETGVTGYYLQVGTNTAISDASLLDQDVGNVLTYNVNGTQEGKTYYARVRAKNGWGLYSNYSSWSNGITVDLSSPTPNPPTIASFAVNVSSIVWTATTAVDILSGLHAQPYSFDDGTMWQTSASSTATGLQPNTLYSKTLKYRDVVGNVTSGAVISTYTLAAVPTSPSFSQVFQTSFTVTWSNNNNPGGTTYIAEISTASNFSSLTGSSTTVNTYSTFTGLNPFTVYYFRVKARNTVSVDSSYSQTVQAQLGDNSAPTGSPSNLTDSGTFTNSTSLAFSWTQGTASDPETGIAGYYLQVGDVLGGNNLFDEDVGNVLTKTVTGTLDGKTYYARVRARNGTWLYGNYSGNSDGITVDITPPTAPTVTSPTHPDSSLPYPIATPSFNVTGPSDLSGITGYYWKIDPSTGTLPTTADNFSSTGMINISTLLTDATWYFHVVAKDGAGNVGTAVIHYKFIVGDNSSPAGTPSTPTDSGAFTSSTTITFNWGVGTVADVETGISGYYLQVGTQPSSGDASLFDGDVGSVLTQTVAGAVGGKTYYARVRARNGVGLLGNWSGWSDGITVDTTPPSAPTVTSATHSDSNKPLAIALPGFSLSGPADLSGIAGYYWKIDGSIATVPTASDTYSSTGTIQTTTLLSDATWYFHVVAKDGAGNIGITATHYKFIVKTMVDPASANTFQSSDGTKVEIPADAVSTAAQLIIQTPANLPPTISDSSLNLTPVAREIKLSDGTRQFNKEITITLPYIAVDVAGMDEQALRLFFYDDTNKLWALIANSSADTVNKRVTGRVTHLTIFGIAQYLPVSSALKNISNYPNPFSPLLGQTTKIRYSLEQDIDARIRIYDPMGQLVWDRSFPAGQNGGVAGPNEVIWDGKTGDGRQVDMGGYICVIEAGGSKFKRKIGVK